MNMKMISRMKKTHTDTALELMVFMDYVITQTRNSFFISEAATTT